jgi:hypothetical protein
METLFKVNYGQDDVREYGVKDLLDDGETIGKMTSKEVAWLYQEFCNGESVEIINPEIHNARVAKNIMNCALSDLTRLAKIINDPSTYWEIEVCRHHLKRLSSKISELSDNQKKRLLAA